MKKLCVGFLTLGVAFVLAGRLPAWSEAGLHNAKTEKSPLESLMNGNERFYRNQPLHPHQTHEHLMSVSQEQHPFAAVLSCSDSRVAPELVFDQGLGDIFDIRVAGNILDPAVLGSLEYAVEHLHTPLIVIMGHERCGAVQAALNHENPHNHINSIIRALAPAVKPAGLSLEQASINNVNHVLHQLHGMPFFEKRIKSGEIKLVGAYYHLNSGQVELLPTSSSQK